MNQGRIKLRPTCNLATKLYHKDLGDADWRELTRSARRIVDERVGQANELRDVQALRAPAAVEPGRIERRPDCRLLEAAKRPQGILERLAVAGEHRSNGLVEGAPVAGRRTIFV